MGFTCGILTSCFHVNPKEYIIQIPSGEKSTTLRFENLVVTRTKGYLHSWKAHVTRQISKKEWTKPDSEEARLQEIKRANMTRAWSPHCTRSGQSSELIQNLVSRHPKLKQFLQAQKNRRGPLWTSRGTSAAVSPVSSFIPYLRWGQGKRYFSVQALGFEVFHFFLSLWISSFVVRVCSHKKMQSTSAHTLNLSWPTGAELNN